MSTRTRSKLADVLQVFFPPRCMACDDVLEADTYFCGHCELGVEAIGPCACASCGEPGVFDTRRCPSCTKTPWRLARARSPYLHHGAVAKAVHRFKYEDHPELGWRLARWAFAELGQQAFAGFDAVCAIPLHAERFGARRYDQATLLAAQWAKCAGLPLRHWLCRRKATARQVGLSDVQRALNVRGAFEAVADVTGQTILLVDDVLTTGATGNAAAQALYQSGARRVELLTLARAQKNAWG
ncbi:MAG: ComF family protein [Myxococcaceae bacterium]|nr:ComF family protein [Myxococcaceae bacterium]